MWYLWGGRTFGRGVGSEYLVAEGGKCDGDFHSGRGSESLDNRVSRISRIGAVHPYQLRELKGGTVLSVAVRERGVICYRALRNRQSKLHNLRNAKRNVQIPV